MIDHVEKWGLELHAVVRCPTFRVMTSFMAGGPRVQILRSRNPSREWRDGACHYISVGDDSPCADPFCSAEGMADHCGRLSQSICFQGHPRWRRIQPAAVHFASRDLRIPLSSEPTFGFRGARRDESLLQLPRPDVIPGTNAR